MLWAVIMAGGEGTRFWPESRRRRPKQFLKIFGRKTLLEQTVDRLKGVVPSGRVIVVTQKANVKLVRSLLKIPSWQIIGEPVGRNTAPCAALAASIALMEDPCAVLAILPADHRIEKPAVFRRALRAAGDIAESEKLPVTFGIKPTYPHTGFGYLELGPSVGRRAGFPVHQLKRFREKPDYTQAKIFLKSKRFLWNSGMFIWRADALTEAARRYQPGIYRCLTRILKGPLKAQMGRWFPDMPNVSIDYGLMERLGGRILAIPADFKWNDLGGWQVIPEMWKHDRQGNVARGKILLMESCGNVVKGDKRLLALVGVRDLVVVDTPDALLICHRKKTEKVRGVVAALKRRGYEEHL
jgi:mannose-1-phosphate guanylyltransferase